MKSSSKLPVKPREVEDIVEISANDPDLVVAAFSEQEPESYARESIGDRVKINLVNGHQVLGLVIGQDEDWILLKQGSGHNIIVRRTNATYISYVRHESNLRTDLLVFSPGTWYNVEFKNGDIQRMQFEFDTRFKMNGKYVWVLPDNIVTLTE